MALAYVGYDPINHIDPDGRSCRLANPIIRFLHDGKVQTVVKGRSVNDGLGGLYSKRGVYLAVKEKRKGMLKDYIRLDDHKSFPGTSSMRPKFTFTFTGDGRIDCNTKKSKRKYYVQGRISWPDGVGTYPMPGGIPAVPKPPFNYASSGAKASRKPNCREAS